MNRENLENALNDIAGIRVVCEYMLEYIKEVFNVTDEEIEILRDKYLTEDDSDEVTYTVYVVDQNGDPVPEPAVGFCIDTACRPVEGDEEGVVVLTSSPQKYHIKVIDAPDGYDFPDDTDIEIGPEEGSETLVITKIED